MNNKVWKSKIPKNRISTVILSLKIDITGNEEISFQKSVVFFEIKRHFIKSKLKNGLWSIFLSRKS